MILKASQRGGGKQLALHLLKTEENEHVEIHEMRGFVSDDVIGAFKEAHAISQGTRCKQYLFSVSLSPPPKENVRPEDFEAAISRIEERTGLTDQPRVIVFHEKEGRRHAHAVWSRIDAEGMKAVHLPHFKSKLRDISKQLYIEHGWQMPRGFVDSKERDPKNFSLDEWQQAKRIGANPSALKSIMQECWAASDSKAAFASALEARGLYLARGDRRGFVALTYEGEAISIARYAGKKNKEIEARLGDPSSARSVEQTKAYIGAQIAPRLHGLIREARSERAAEMKPLDQHRLEMRDYHANERAKLDARQKARELEEAKERTERLRKGMAGLWDRLTGARARTLKQNEMEALDAARRDSQQRHDLRHAQLQERQRLQTQIEAARNRHREKLLSLHADLSRAREMRKSAPPPRERIQTLRAETRTPEVRPSNLPTPQDRLAALRAQIPRPRARDRDFERD